MWSVQNKHVFIFLNVISWFQREERGASEREIHLFTVPLIYVIMGLFLYVPWKEIKATNLVYQKDTPTTELPASASKVFIKGRRVCLFLFSSYSFLKAGQGTWWLEHSSYFRSWGSLGSESRTSQSSQTERGGCWGSGTPRSCSPCAAAPGLRAVGKALLSRVTHWDLGILVSDKVSSENQCQGCFREWRERH